MSLTNKFPLSCVNATVCVLPPFGVCLSASRCLNFVCAESCKCEKAMTKMNEKKQKERAHPQSQIVKVVVKQQSGSRDLCAKEQKLHGRRPQCQKIEIKIG